MEEEGSVNIIRPRATHQSSSVQPQRTPPHTTQPHDKGPKRKTTAHSPDGEEHETSDVIPASDQPLDMSLTTRKRANPSSHDDPPPPVKKLRLSPTEQENRTPLRHLPVLPTNPKLQSTTTPTLIISPEYSLEGINTHFQRSLSKYTTDAEREVDEHFVRSLGWEVWGKILQSKTRRTNNARREGTRQKRNISSKPVKSNATS